MISHQDARMMFQNSLVDFKGLLVYITSITEDGFTCFNLETQQTENHKSKYDDLKAPQSRLGYVNFGNVCGFVSRVPARVYKVGLARDNIRSSFEGLPVPNAERKFLQELIMSLTSPAFVKTFKNEYYSLSEVIEMLDKGASAVAFDRQFALTQENILVYKGRIVASFDRKEKTFEFDDRERYLESILYRSLA